MTAEKSHENAEGLKETAKAETELGIPKPISEMANSNQADVDNLKKALTKPSPKPISPIIISLIFLILGTLSLALSILTSSQVLAFLGLGLTFWGALFLLIRPVSYVKSTLLDATAISAYTTIDRIIQDLEYKGKSFYIPPYPKDVFIPDHLRGLKELIAFIPADDSTPLPSIEEMARSKFIIKNPKGICIIPPGSGLVEQIGKELRTDPARMNLETLCETLPQIILESFRLAKEIEMKTEQNQVHLRILDSVYKPLYLQEGMKSVYSLGCPVVSAIACEIAIVTGKLVSIDSMQISLDAQTITVTYKITEA